MSKPTDSEILADIEEWIKEGFEDEKRAGHVDAYLRGYYEYGKVLARRIQFMRGEATSDNAPGRD